MGASWIICNISVRSQWSQLVFILIWFYSQSELFKPFGLQITKLMLCDVCSTWQNDWIVRPNSGNSPDLTCYVFLFAELAKLNWGQLQAVQRISQLNSCSWCSARHSLLSGAGMWSGYYLKQYLVCSPLILRSSLDLIG